MTMKLILTEIDGRFNVVIRDATGINLDSYTFGTQTEAEAFCSGFLSARKVINSLIQSLPLGREFVNSAK